MRWGSKERSKLSKDINTAEVALKVTAVFYMP